MFASYAQRLGIAFETQITADTLLIKFQNNIVLISVLYVEYKAKGQECTIIILS